MVVVPIFSFLPFAVGVLRLLAEVVEPILLERQSILVPGDRAVHSHLSRLAEEEHGKRAGHHPNRNRN